jgi:hypothetical protein
VKPSKGKKAKTKESDSSKEDNNGNSKLRRDWFDLLDAVNG